MKSIEKVKRSVRASLSFSSLSQGRYPIKKIDINSEVSTILLSLPISMSNDLNQYLLLDGVPAFIAWHARISPEHMLIACIFLSSLLRKTTLLYAKPNYLPSICFFSRDKNKYLIQGVPVGLATLLNITDSPGHSYQKRCTFICDDKLKKHVAPKKIIAINGSGLTIISTRVNTSGKVEFTVDIGQRTQFLTGINQDDKSCFIGKDFNLSVSLLDESPHFPEGIQKHQAKL